jgi:ubiquinone/menaquinone biosynthesis C-methylase UbiE
VGFYEQRVLPRITDKVMRRADLDVIRARVTADLAGEVLEVGFGSGLNVAHYPKSITRVLAVDPATLGRKLAAPRVSARGIVVDYVGLDGQSLPLQSDSVDHVLSTWTLCTIPDAAQAMAEVSRVLRRGGTFHFVEHGRSPQPAVARWQDRLTPLQRRVAGGCHLNRPIDELITESGLTLARIDNFYAKGPKAFGYMYEGIAAKQ